MARVIPVPADVALEGTYLNDIRFSPDGSTGYITDSGTRGAIIVVDLRSGRSFRALDGDKSTQIDKSVTVKIDGVPLRRPDGRQPAFAADGIRALPRRKHAVLPGTDRRQLYGIDTAKLRPS